MKKTVACIIARTNSTRLPKKVLKTIAKKRMIEHIIDRLKLCTHIDVVYICTSTTQEDYVLKSIADKNNIHFYAGSEDCIIDRMIDVAEIEKADNLIRITGDNIFTDSVYTDLMITFHKQFSADYTRTEYLPVGVTSEVLSVSAAKKIYDTIPRDESQYLMLYAFQPDLFMCNVLVPPPEHQRKNWTLTVDDNHDWERTEYLFRVLGKGIFCYEDIINLSDTMRAPYLLLDPVKTVKLPAKVNLYHGALRYEMDLRIENSNQINISLADYARFRNEQKI